ncbi:hydrolase [Mycolicibacterium insubricum]|uniref:Alpha/beta hydrolase n=1 Tax=Mycolicibacterium insubricum TaxID=444597 RepID=A0A1X0DGV0_9MYCO|nr:alpha/beta hydrolase [Mycolicibacterium insubricum]MCB9439436.1 alpha/beta hydrolase [Mycolicibacterium sp.]MCV7081983.1 alpha/beta hydrolase [Mycolicibacterium insubricum]ORA71626.1 alpha/beta hydrolase [Mycolicibacterium insubricum]BBZ65143.1 hydrolase [Mycolicibacterium insubricum]
MLSDDELLALDEFALLPENAAQAGHDGPLPPVQRLEHGDISALAWGADPAQIVFLHGGGQNAHTWDTVIVGLGLPALAVDLPGHGHSAWREDGDYGPRLNAQTVAPVLRELAPRPRLVVGMSLGGLTALRIAATESALVPELVLVDVTPSAPARHEEMTKAQLGAVALVQGQRSFTSFTEMLDETVAAAPHRSRESLRRGVFHNARRLDDGSWTWRYDSFRTGAGFEGLWDDVPAITMPTTLVRGAHSHFVNDDDASQFAATAPGFRATIVVDGAGHSVQGDQPLELIRILRGLLAAG